MKKLIGQEHNDQLIGYNRGQIKLFELEDDLMKTELTYLEARVTALVSYVQELRKNHSALQHVLVEHTEQQAEEQKALGTLREENSALKNENTELKDKLAQLQATVDEGVQEIKSIIELLPEFAQEDGEPFTEKAIL